jgi:hypothetical protein
MALPAAASHWPEVNRTGAEIFPIDSGHDGGGGGGLEGYERAAEIREASASTFDGLIQRFSQVRSSPLTRVARPADCLALGRRVVVRLSCNPWQDALLRAPSPSLGAGVV